MRRERGQWFVTVEQMNALTHDQRDDLTDRLVRHAQDTNHTITMTTTPLGHLYRWWPNEEGEA